MSPFLPYARICDGCGHSFSRHGLNRDAPTIRGPYHCRYADCACEVMQDAPTTPISQAEFVKRFGKPENWKPAR